MGILIENVFIENVINETFLPEPCLSSPRNGCYWRSLLTAVCEKAVGSYSKDVACVYVIWLAKKAVIIAYLDRVPDLLCVINVLWDLYGALIPIEFDF